MIKRPRTNRISINIATAIKKQIAAGSLQLGDRLPAERAMVRRHRVSRVSVREAYRALQDAGVITVRRGSAGGAFIAAPHAARIGESLALALRLGDGAERQVREASRIEPLVAALAARHASPDDLARLQKLVDTPGSAIRRGHFRQHRSRFHIAVADCARNLALAAVVASIAKLSGTLDAALEADDGCVDLAQSWHRAVYDVIAAGDEPGASEQMGAYWLWMHGLVSRPPNAGAECTAVPNLDTSAA